jgi:hypothetical protein
MFLLLRLSTRMQILVPANVASMAFPRGLVCTPCLPLKDCNHWVKTVYSLHEDLSVTFHKDFPPKPASSELAASTPSTKHVDST